MGSLSKVVKKIARPKVLLPLAAIAIGGPMLAKAAAAKGAAAGAAGAGAGAGGSGIMSTLFGTAGSTAATGATTAGKTARAMNLLKAGTTTFPATSGLLGTAGGFAPLKGTLAKGAMYGLKNPFTKQGLMTYGGAGLGLAALMGKEKTEAQKNLGVDAQAQYDLAREMNRMMGGAYTDEQLNTITAPMLSQYGGEYETITDPMRKRRPMFPGLNYSGLTRYAADGGTIVGDDELSQRLFGEMMGAQMSDNVPEDMFNPINPMNPMGGPHKEEDIGLYDMYEAFDKKNKEMMDFKRMRKTKGEEIRQNVEDNKERIFEEFDKVKQQQAIQGEEYRQNVYDAYVDRYEEMSEGPMGPFMKPMKTFEEMFPFTVEEKSMGGRIEMGLGGIIGRAIREAMQAAMKNPNLGKVFGRSGGDLGIGDIEKIIKPTPRVAPRDGRLSNVDVFGRRRPRDIDTLQDEVIDQMMEMDSIEGFAHGGSIPQTPMMPQGMQLDGRGGGFIPMGAQEKKDDVPAMLAKNEFVMTSDAVRAAGGGDINKGAQKMYDLMNNLESKV